MYVDRKTGERIDLGQRLTLSLGVMSLNQGLVQFADQKANGLVVVSSIFLASLVPTLERLALVHPHLRHVGLLACAVAIAALLAALRVMLARSGGRPATGHAVDERHRSLVFFKHVSAVQRGADYVDAFRESEGERVLDSLLLSNHDVCLIATKKFAAYKLAERLTVAAAVLWGATMLLGQLRTG